MNNYKIVMGLGKVKGTMITQGNNIAEILAKTNTNDDVTFFSIKKVQRIRKVKPTVA